MSARIRLKCKDPTRPPSQALKESTRRTLHQHSIDFYRLIDVYNGWIVVTVTDEDYKSMFEGGTVLRALDAIGIVVTMPIALRARYTVVLKNLDHYVLDQPEQDIKEEIERTMPAAVNKITEIYKMPQFNIVKVKLNDLTLAERI